ncbi:MAG: spore germination protein [Bacillota bacterium]|nr:spore germination protein [Bacillota bacterium]
MRKQNSFWQKLKSKFKKKAQKKPGGNEQELLKDDVGEIPPELKLSTKLKINLDNMKRLLGESGDLNFREFVVGEGKGIQAAIFWVDGMADKEMISENIVKSVAVGAKALSPSLNIRSFYEEIKERYLNVGDIKETDSFAEAVYAGLSGDTVFLLDGYAQAIIASTREFAARGIEEPASEVVIRGPREGFTETLRMNTGLLRRRLKNPNLRMESTKIGRQSQTDVAIVYVKGIVNPEVLEEVKKRLNRIETDIILESSYLEEMIEDAPFSIFPTVTTSERPDSVIGSIMEGRVALIIDGTPFALIMPTIFFQLFQTAEDYYSRYPIATFSRWLRLFGLAVTLLLPSLYIATTTFHPEIMPTTLLLTVAASREGVPFPAFVEAFVMEVTFEVLREAGVRMPRPVGQAVSIVGALVLGDAAISAGIVSPPMVVIVAATAIASFLIPNPDVVGSVRLLRFAMMLLAASLGYFGIAIGVIAIHIHLVSLRSFGVPYMWPFGPFNLVGLRDVLLRVPHWSYRFRPEIFTWQEQERMESGQNMPTKPHKHKVKETKRD